MTSPEAVTWNAVVVPSSPLMLGPLGAATPLLSATSQSGTPASSDAENTTQVFQSVADPLGDVRAAALDAVRWLVVEHPSRVLVLTAPADPANVARGVTTPLGERVGRSLLAAAGFTGEVVVDSDPRWSSSGWSSSPSASEQGSSSRWSSRPRNEADQSRPRLPEGTGVLVVGDGSARRGEKAPGHLDERSFELDSGIEKALRDCDAAGLSALSPGLGAELLAAGVPAFRALGALPDAESHTAVVDYADDPLGVQYWIVRWQCAS